MSPESELAHAWKAAETSSHSRSQRTGPSARRSCLLGSQLRMRALHGLVLHRHGAEAPALPKVCQVVRVVPLDDAAERVLEQQRRRDVQEGKVVVAQVEALVLEPGDCVLDGVASDPVHHGHLLPLRSQRREHGWHGIPKVRPLDAREHSHRPAGLGVLEAAAVITHELGARVGLTVALERPVPRPRGVGAVVQALTAIAHERHRPVDRGPLRVRGARASEDQEEKKTKKNGKPEANVNKESEALI